MGICSQTSRKLVALLVLWAGPTVAGLPEEAARVRKTLRSEPLKARAMVAALLTGNDGSALIRALSGDVAFRLANFEKAHTEYRHALQLDPNDARALRGMGRLAEICSYRKIARSFFERAYKADPDDPEILLNYASLLHGDDEVEALERYIAIARDADAEEIEDARAELAMRKATRGRQLNRLTSPYQPSTLRLDPVLNDKGAIRGFSVSARIGSAKNLHLLLDTGASGVILNRNAGKKAGLKPVSSSPLRGVGKDDDRSAYVSIADHLRIGDVEFDEFTVRVAERNAINGADGIIGSDVFKHFQIAIDFPGGVIRLTPFADGSIDPDGHDHDRVGREGYLDAYLIGSHVFIAAEANGKGPALFLVDSGAYSNLLSRTFAADIGRLISDYSLRLSGVAGDVKEVFKLDRLELRFGDIRQSSKDVLSFDFGSLCKSEGVEISGLFGFRAMADLIVELDYRNGLVRFTASARR